MTPELPQIGEIVGGHYVVVAVRGQGMMGALLEAEDRRDGQRVALKVLRPQALQVSGVAERLHREGRLIAALTSPHAVRVFDVGRTEGGLPFLVMELLAGTDLGKELERGPLPLGLAVHLVRQACHALSEAHAQGITHRDVKPSNLFVTRTANGRPHLKVLDFGVSKGTGDGPQLTALDASLGTPLYMSPEQIRSARHVDGRSDVWSLAVSLFELVTGAPPFRGETATAVAAAIIADEPIPLRSLLPAAPAGLERVLLDALEKDPAKRIPSARDLSDALAPFDELSPGAAPGASTQGPSLGVSTHGRPLAAPAASEGPPGAAPPPSADPRSVAGPGLAAVPPPRMRRSTLALAVVGGLLIGLLAVAVVILGWRRVRGDATPPLEAAGLVEPERTVGDLIGAAAATSRWRPCLLEADRKAPALPALAHPEHFATPLADLDATLSAMPAPVARLAPPWGERQTGARVLSLLPLTPVPRALRAEEAVVLYVTKERTRVGVLGDALLDDVSGPEKLSELASRLSGVATPWVVVPTRDLPLRRLSAVLTLLDTSRGPVVLAMAAEGAPVQAPGPGPDGLGGFGCPNPRWKGGAAPREEAKAIEAAVRELESGCAREIPGASGTRLRLTLQVSDAGEVRACVDSAEWPQTRLLNCVVHGARKLRFPTTLGSADRLASFDLAFESAPVRPLCPPAQD